MMEPIGPAQLVRGEHVNRIMDSPRLFPDAVYNLAQEMVQDASEQDLLMAMRSVRNELNQRVDQRMKARADQVFNLTHDCHQPGAVRSGRKH